MAPEPVRRSTSFRVVLLLLALAAAARLPGQQGTSPTQFPVRGTVVNSLSGQPVARALVVLEPGFAMLTTDDGTFSFDNVPAGQHNLSVRRPGFVALGSGQGMVQSFQTGNFAARSLPPIQLLVGQDMPAVTVPITPQASIAGTVTLSTGDAAGEIRVSFFRREIENGRPRWQTAGFATSRADGSFHFDGLEPGRYMLYTQATLDQSADTSGSRIPVWGFPPVYYPGVTDPSAAGILNLTAGQRAEADFTLTRQRFFPVTAAVRSPSSQRFVSLELTDPGGRPAGFPTQYDPRDQIAHLEVPNGSWSLIGHGYGHTMFFGETNFQVAGAPLSISISLLPVPRIPVTINRDFTSADDQQISQRRGAGLNFFLVPASSFDRNGSGGYLSPVPGSQNSAWQISPGRPGSFWVQATAFAPAYVASVSSGGADLAVNPLVVLPGSDPPPIEITLRDDSAQITGEVDGLAGERTTPGIIPRIWVYAIPLSPSAIAVPPEAWVSTEGTFTFSGLAPGQYRVVACDRQQQIDSHSPDVLAAWSGLGQTVTVDPGGSAHVTLDILHREPGP